LHITGGGIDCWYHVAEEAPADLEEAFTAFFSQTAGGTTRRKDNTMASKSI